MAITDIAIQNVTFIGWRIFSATSEFDAQQKALSCASVE